MDAFGLKPAYLQFTPGVAGLDDSIAPLVAAAAAAATASDPLRLLVVGMHCGKTRSFTRMLRALASLLRQANDKIVVAADEGAAGASGCSDTLADVVAASTDPDSRLAVVGLASLADVVAAGERQLWKAYPSEWHAMYSHF